MAPLRVSTTKSEWLPDDPTAFVPTRLWKLPFITTWDDSRNQNRPTDSAEEATWDSFSPGRLDQHLAPFYEHGLAGGTLDREAARELLECFWVKFNNQPAPPKVGVTAAESATYTDFCNINTGGLKGDGSDGVGDVTWLILDAIDEMRLLQPSSNLQLSKKSPDRFLKRGLEIVRQGWGNPP